MRLQWFGINARVDTIGEYRHLGWDNLMQHSKPVLRTFDEALQEWILGFKNCYLQL